MCVTRDFINPLGIFVFASEGDMSASPLMLKRAAHDFVSIVDHCRRVVFCMQKFC